ADARNSAQTRLLAVSMHPIRRAEQLGIEACKRFGTASRPCLPAAIRHFFHALRRTATITRAAMLPWDPQPKRVSLVDTQPKPQQMRGVRLPLTSSPDPQSEHRITCWQPACLRLRLREFRRRYRSRASTNSPAL